ncbi:MAG: type II secretion system F family protein [Candidatus Omnitrophota bacterium]
MPIFKYRAKKGPDEIIEDTLQAQSKEEVIEFLAKSGYFALKIEEVSRQTSSSLSATFSGRIKTKDLVNFSRQLSTLLRSGVPILKSLDIISEQCENANFKSILSQIKRRIENGEKLSAALSEYPYLFSSLYVTMVQAGEVNGTMEESLSRISEHLKKQQEILSRIRAALTYPLFVVLTSIGTIIFMLIFVMPRLTQVFSALGQELPLPTKIVLTVSASIRRWWFLVVIGLVIVVQFLRQQFTGKKTFWSRSKLRLPFLGRFFVQVELSRLCRTLELLTKSGIPILKSIETAIPILESETLQEGIRRSQKEVEEGHSFGEALKKEPLIPPLVTNLITVGEESGRLSETFAEIADFYEKETADLLQTTTALVEPLLILGVGLMVGFVVIAMLFPIFQINMMVK